MREYLGVSSLCVGWVKRLLRNPTSWTDRWVARKALNPTYALLATTMLLALVSCGQSGKLYLPNGQMRPISFNPPENNGQFS
jgi:predicted small lipoprotein YifL